MLRVLEWHDTDRSDFAKLEPSSKTEAVFLKLLIQQKGTIYNENDWASLHILRYLNSGL